MAVFQIGPQAIKPTAVGEVTRGLQAFRAGQQQIQQQKQQQQSQQLQQQLGMLKLQQLRSQIGQLGQPGAVPGGLELTGISQAPTGTTRTFGKPKATTPLSQTQFAAQIAQKIAEGTANEQEEVLFDRLVPPPTTKDEEGVRATGLRKEFDANQSVKNFAIVQRQVGIIQEAFDEATAASGKSRIASDQALVIAFNKLLDPTSVVRESEFARTPLQAALVNRIRATPEQIKKGGITITNDDRRAILDMANRAAAVTGRQFNSVHDRFGNLAGLSKVNPELIFGGMARFEPTDPRDAFDEDAAKHEIQAVIDSGIVSDSQIKQINERVRQGGMGELEEILELIQSIPKPEPERPPTIPKPLANGSSLSQQVHDRPDTITDAFGTRPAPARGGPAITTPVAKKATPQGDTIQMLAPNGRVFNAPKSSIKQLLDSNQGFRIPPKTSTRTATNPDTNERMISFDRGRTWQKL